MSKRIMRYPIALLATLTLAACSPPATDRTVSEADLRAIRDVHAAYGAAWRANDSAAVLATLADDVVLMPSGMAPIVGRQAAAAYWWPEDGPPTTITSYEGIIEEVRASGDLAVVRARSSMAFTWENEGETTEVTNRGMSISVIERGRGGRWRITMRMWGRLIG